MRDSGDVEQAARNIVELPNRRRLKRCKVFIRRREVREVETAALRPRAEVSVNGTKSYTSAGF